MNFTTTPLESGPASIRVDGDQFANDVDLRPFPIHHGLQHNELFHLDRLADLAMQLPETKREYVFAKHQFGAHDSLEHYRHAKSQDQASTAEMIHRLEEQNTVIVLRNIEADPDYAAFVNDCLDRLSSVVEPTCGPISQREGFIFISPPRAYTPYHWDPEQNFFLQVKGGKEMAIYDVSDRDVLPEVALERYYSNGQKITPCPKESFDRHQLFAMGPGDGVYVPVTAPHWVRTLDEVSISVTVNFRTPSSIRRGRAYRFNHMLRRVGLPTAPVSPRADMVGDRAKASLLALPAALKRWVR